jgi:hypothetical protein
MAKNEIENMEFKLSGARWNEVMLSEYHEGRRIEHRYYSIKKNLVMKLLNSSKAPTISDFEGWLREEEQKEKKAKGDKTECPVDSGSDWWASRD